MDLEAIAKRIVEILEAEGNRPVDLGSVKAWWGYDVQVTPWSIEVTCTEEDDRYWTLMVGGRTRFGCALSADEITPTAHKVLAAVVAMMVPTPSSTPLLAVEQEQEVEQHGHGEAGMIGQAVDLVDRKTAQNRA